MDSVQQDSTGSSTPLDALILSASTPTSITISSLPPELISHIISFLIPTSFSLTFSDPLLLLSRTTILKSLSLLRLFHLPAQFYLYSSPYIRLDRLARLFSRTAREKGREGWVKELRMDGYHMSSGSAEAILRECRSVESVWMRFFADKGRGMFSRSTALKTLVLDHSQFTHSLGFPTHLPTTLTSLYIAGSSTSTLLLQSLCPSLLPALKILSVSDIQDYSRSEMLDCFRSFNQSELGIWVLRLHEFADLLLQTPHLDPSEVLGLTTPIMWTITPGPTPSRDEDPSWLPLATQFRHVAFILFLPSHFDFILSFLGYFIPGGVSTIKMRRIYAPQSIFPNEDVDEWDDLEGLLKVKIGVEMVDSGERQSNDLHFVVRMADSALEWEEWEKTRK